jgi:sortase A
VRARPSRLVRVERALVVIGIACLGYYGYQSAEARHFQREQTAAFESLLERALPPAVPETPVAPEVLKAPEAPAPVSPAVPVSPAPPAPATLGMLEIPRLALSTPVLSGDDDATLDIAVGHLPDTPLPWEPGNSAFAAHRDGLFRPLRNIRVGDEVRVRTLRGEFIYRVREMKVVLPTDLSVLASSDAPTLTLITCYPFNFVGNAPKRFIVHADQLP